MLIFNKIYKIYDDVLKTNDDILTSLIYKNLIYDSNKIISLTSYVYHISSRFNYTTYASSLVRVVLQFDIIYNPDALDKILSAACYYNDINIIKHIEKLNNITNHCYNRLKGLDPCEIFDYLFEKLLNHGSADHLTRMAERTFSNYQYDLFKKVVKTGRITNITNLLGQLVKYNQIELVSLLFSSNKVIISKKQRSSYYNISPEMRELVNAEVMLKYMYQLSFIHAAPLIKAKDPKLLISNGGSMTLEDWSNPNTTYIRTNSVIKIPAQVVYTCIKK